MFGGGGANFKSEVSSVVSDLHLGQFGVVEGEIVLNGVERGVPKWNEHALGDVEV